ncbi:Trafficking protein particle complex subunit 8 [Symbiodinium microadriaticum]|uniref:Trafficking protein particle complex subunit 8 n=1 Tax=Symbiodinium microadriaticum TaxID=2951 RepID=A0A1Q9DDD3_SYMMI|nr:Trafficking protein particle complex subunit 8 [Symbiodinium microadriaticum]
MSTASDVVEDAAAYPLHSVEGQMRLAGDLSFHLRDYEVALSYYRNVVSDFKQDRSWKHAAGAYEMWGLCAYITGGARSEWMRCMESSYEHYLQASSSRLAMRAVALHQAMVSDVKEAALRLMKVNGDLADNNLKNALILEQAGQLYYASGSARKGAFHLVLAGHTYNKLGFKRLALFSYQAVVELYLGKGWFHITDHFHFTMARQAFGLGMKDESLVHFLKLLNSFADAQKKVCIQADRENTYIKEFIYVVKDWVQTQSMAEDTSTVDLQIPCLDHEVRVYLSDDKQREPPLPSESSVASWEHLGEKVIPNLSQEDRQELGWRQRSDVRIFDTLRRVSATGAKVFVELALTNPMRVKWEIVGLTLRGRLLDSNNEPSADTQAVEFTAQDVELGPLESKQIRLAALPQREGLLQILGIRWTIFDCHKVVCERPFQLKGRRLRNTLEQRASKTGVYSGDLRLEIKVRSWKPRLQARLEGWPVQKEQSTEASAALLQGELRRCSLVITSDDLDCPLTLLQVATSHPQYLALEEPDTKSSKEISVRLTDEGIRLQGKLTALFDAAAHELRLPVLLRVDTVGVHTLRLLILAEAEGPGGPKCDQRQWITLEDQVGVEPAVSVTARPSPSFTSDGRFIFTCLVENRAAAPVHVTGMSGFCDTGLVPLDLQAFTTGEPLIEPGDSVQLLYALCWPAEGAQVQQEARWRLLHACRQAAAVSYKSKSKTHRKPIATDLAVQWRQGATIGEAFSLQVPLERPEAPPCPLDLHLLAPAAAEVSQLVPVTVKIRNASLAGPVSFYFVAESTADLAWVGCERSEIIRLPANEYHSETIQAYFSQPGVYNLNRFRLFVVGMCLALGRCFFDCLQWNFDGRDCRPSSTVPASEQAPMAFAVPFERLLHVQASGDTVENNHPTATVGPPQYQPEAFTIKHFDLFY